MSNQLTILGLGPFGQSLGRAFSAVAADRFTRVGCDYRPDREKQARSRDAVDKIVHNIPNAVREADLILLALPADELEEILKLIADEIKPTAIIFDFSPCKSAAVEWAKKYLPESSLFLGAWSVTGARKADQNPFLGGTMFFSADIETNEAVIRNAAVLAKWLGAKACFAEPAELDSLIARTYLAPYLLQAALFASVSSQPAWENTRSSYGTLLMEETSLLEIPVGNERNADAFLNNRESTLYALNALEAELKCLRDALAEKDAETLETFVLQSRKYRSEWKEKVFTGQTADERISAPTASETLGNVFLGGLFRRKKD